MTDDRQYSEAEIAEVTEMTHEIVDMLEGRDYDLAIQSLLSAVLTFVDGSLEEGDEPAKWTILQLTEVEKEILNHLPGYGQIH